MDGDKRVAWLGAVVTWILIAAFGGYYVGKHIMSVDAVKNGVAYWQPDDNGRVQLVWKECK